MTDGTHGVVVAQPEDEDAIYRHVQMLHKENGMWPLSEEKVRATIRSATRGEGIDKNIIGIVKGKDGTAEGSICLHLTSVYYSDIWHWCEKWIYVMPEYRRSEHAKHLIQFAKWCADTMSNSIAGEDGAGQQEVPLIVGILTEENLIRKMRLYQRAGLQQCGAWFMYRGLPDRTFYNQRRLEN